MENNFIIYNRNPEGKNIKDCVVRAFSTAFDLSYDLTLQRLTLARSELHYKSIKDTDFIDEYLEKIGSEKLSFKPEKGKPRIKLCQFADQHKDGVYIVRVKGHIAAVIEGCVLDTWDSTYLTVYKAWKVPSNTTLEDLGLDKCFGEHKEPRRYGEFIL